MLENRGGGGGDTAVYARCEFKTGVCCCERDDSASLTRHRLTPRAKMREPCASSTVRMLWRCIGHVNGRVGPLSLILRLCHDPDKIYRHIETRTHCRPRRNLSRGARQRGRALEVLDFSTVLSPSSPAPVAGSHLSTELLREDFH